MSRRVPVAAVLLALLCVGAWLAFRSSPKSSGDRPVQELAAQDPAPVDTGDRTDTRIAVSASSEDLKLSAPSAEDQLDQTHTETGEGDTAEDGRASGDNPPLWQPSASEARMSRVRHLIVACYELLHRFEGEWPEDASTFVQLHDVGHVIDAVHGRSRESGERGHHLAALPSVVYRPPPFSLHDPKFNPQWVIFYERYIGKIPDGGIVVGFADGHIERIDDEEQLFKLLDLDQ